MWPKKNGLTEDEVISLHSEPAYQIYMIGFTPGFPFLGGLKDELATPRLETPRAEVPAGSVGIANSQTGIYPVTSPGGWQLIGRTPLKIFDPGPRGAVSIESGGHAQIQTHRQAGIRLPVGRGCGVRDALKVIQPGPFSTVQDLGRFGSQRFGVPVSGSMDGYAHRVANLLVGNPEEAACLEMTFMGAKFEALNALIVAVCGAEAPVSVNGDPRESWSAIKLKPGDVLSVGMAQKGLRSYLAIGGGIDVPLVMGSRSTYIGGALGGFKGRVLQKGDILPGGEPNPQAGGVALPVEFRPVYSPRKTLRALPRPPG